MNLQIATRAMQAAESTDERWQWRAEWKAGSRRWVVRDSWTLQHYELSELQHTIWQLRQAGHSPSQITLHLQRQLPDLEVRLQDVTAFVSELQSAGLAVATQLSQPSSLNHRQRMSARSRAKVYSWWSPWTIRLPLFDPTPWLAWAGPLARTLFHPVAVMTVVLLAMLATLHALGSLDIGTLDWRKWQHPGIWLGGLLVWLLAKSCHELGHALACRKYQVECHEIGLLWLFCLPCLYCDVSDSWRLRRRWPRMAIALAGIYVELIIALLAYALWLMAVPGVFKSVMLLTAISTSVGTILINANPLLRYDGYFVLSDLLGWHNLWPDAAQALRSLAGWCWGVSLACAFETRHFLGLLSFGLCSLAYRILLTGALLLGIQQILPVGQYTVLSWLLMLGLLLPWLAATLVSARAIAAGQPQSLWLRAAKRLLLFGLAMGVLYVFYQVPVSQRLVCRARVQTQLIPIYAPAGGTLAWVASDGATIQQRERLVELHDFHKAQTLRKLRLEVEVLDAAVARLEDQQVTDSTVAAILPATQALLKGKREQLEVLQAELQRLQIAATHNGIWRLSATLPLSKVSPRLSNWAELKLVPIQPQEMLIGAGCERGVLLGHIQTDTSPVIEAYLPEEVMDLLDTGQPVEVRLDSHPESALPCQIIEVLPASYTDSLTDWPSQDWLLPVVQTDQQLKLASPHLLVRLKLLTDHNVPWSEQWATAHLQTRQLTSAARCWRWIQTTFVMGRGHDPRGVP